MTSWLSKQLLVSEDLDLVAVSEAARILELTPARVHQLIARGDFQRVVKISEQRFVYLHRSDVEALAARRRNR